jgi:hypothetical protein
MIFEAGYKNLTTPESKKAASEALLSNIKEAIEVGILVPAMIYDHIATIDGNGATPKEIEAAKDVHASDEVNIDSTAWSSRADNGYWVHAWVWVDKPESDEEACSECGEPVDDGEGYDGLCGTCADKKENEETA